MLLNDVVVPRLEDLPSGSASDIRSGYLNMMMLFNAGDREISDWALLFELASPGFQFRGREQPPGSGLCVLEAVWNRVWINDRNMYLRTMYLSSNNTYCISSFVPALKF